MDIKTFKVERWMNEYEGQAVYNLAETCVDSITIKELLELAGEDVDSYMRSLADLRLSYSHIFGSPQLLAGIASLYKDVKPQHVIPTHGAIGANNQVITTLIGRDDNMVSVMPTYQQHYSIPESIGADVRILQLTLEDDYLPNLDVLRSLVDEKTKMITINNPNNPTGSWIPVDIMQEIIEIAKSVDAYVLCDEVYRGIAEDERYMHSIVDLYDKGISVGSMSKVFSMAGVRMGWIVTKDYDTISCGVVDDALSSLALAHKEAIFARNRGILNKNRAILDQWVNETPEVKYLRPVAGTTALVYYNKDIPSQELCKKLLFEKGVLFTPGECFEMEGAVRIGYAYDSKTLREGLDKFTEFLREL